MRTAVAKAAQGRMSLASVQTGKRARPLITLLYGPAGVGKTTFGASAPRPIFLCGEDGAGHLDIARFPPPESWADVLAACDALAAGGHSYGALAIDSLDWLEPLAWQQVCLVGRKDSIEDFGYGKGYVMALDLWRELYERLQRVRAAGLHVVMIAHAEIKTFKNPEGDDWDRYQLKLHQKAGALLTEASDNVLFANFDTRVRKDRGALKAKATSTGERILHTQRCAAFDAKNRYDLPAELPLSWADYVAAVTRAVGPTVDPARLEAMRAEVRAMLPGLTDDERTKAERALVEWAGDSPARLVQLIEKVRAKVADEPSAREPGED